MLTLRCCWLALSTALLLVAALRADEPVALPNTQPLEMGGDIAMQMVAGVDKFLLRKTDESAAAREANWKRDFKVDADDPQSLATKRQRLARMLGVSDRRVPFTAPEIRGSLQQQGRVASGKTFDVYAIRWPVIGDVCAEGLLLEPRGNYPVASVVAIPDADQTPEMIVGLQAGLKPDLQFARQLAEGGARVVVVDLVGRDVKPRSGRAKLTDREFVYRSAFVMGRHVIGYELQKVLAAVDWFVKDAGQSDPKIGVMGYGEGGMLALYAAALDTRIDAMATSGFFGRRENAWKEPVDRNVFGILNEFGDAEVLAMIYPRSMLLNGGVGPDVTLTGEGGAPGELRTPPYLEAAEQHARASLITANIKAFQRRKLSVSMSDKRPFYGPDSVIDFFHLLTLKHKKIEESPLTWSGDATDAPARKQRQLHELDRHTQQLLAESPYVRAEFMKGLDTSSLEKFEKSAEAYREKFKRETIGWFDDERLPLNPRTRRIIDKETHAGYEVVLDLWPDVFAYGVLLLPKNIPAGEKRPVVVCQHGLEGRPLDTIQGDHAAYHDFATKLCERGFIVFCPQNLYLGGDKFRTLQRKANPLGKTLFSIIIPEHQQVVAWLKTLPEVDGERIAFYGLSYGGKSAMRIPPLVPEYCLSICSADFNDWVWKNASTRSPYSYVWTGEYEIFEWNLGSTFNYAEMAALIAPRPFMVERGHFDGVAPDEAVAAEFAKVRHLYAARLKIPERCEIEFFDGPHTINGKGTFAFLHKHLKWPEPK